ncbi:hypothetical protein DEU56DRAFT_785833 [Suillus clintonianus]|uniref:uncharacterized protein n=1 Tax=Suillus clintonianus TaxID=1904413 RepID=UPI001B869A4C|nr:uncharacterized protein DEU56DRAFT_785833 [Suillus clintonianus]KAG2146680.1 hypothetical protein DEU56DRAFT_785833 [Suillus clintonianus]
MDALDSLDTVRRRGIDSGLGNLLGGNGAASSFIQTAVSAAESGSDSNPFGGIASAISSIVGGVSPIVGSTITGATIVTSSKSTSSSTSTASSTPSTTSTSAPTLSTPPSSTPTPTQASTPASSASLIVIPSTDGTSIVYVTSVATISATSTAAPAVSFLQNKPLEGGVFALVGIVIMVIIFVVVTYTIRRRQRNRLESVIADAITFDPAVTEHYGDEEKGMNTYEKYRLSGSSSGHGHGFGYGPQPAYAPPVPPVPPQYGYYGSQGYEQQAAAYRVPSTQGPVYNHDNAVNTGGAVSTDGVVNTGGAVDPDGAVNAGGAVNTGGANLTRKYSNRKPVPPLLLNPVYDPSRSPVLPSHFMQNQDTPVSPIALSMSPSIPPGDIATPALPAPALPAPALPAPALPDDLEDDPYTGMLKVVNR